MRDNLNSYWLKWVNSCRRFTSIGYIALLVSLKTIEWGVLGVSRLYYTFNEKNITSKVGAGEYALKTVPANNASLQGRGRQGHEVNYNKIDTTKNRTTLVLTSCL